MNDDVRTRQPHEVAIQVYGPPLPGLSVQDAAGVGAQFAASGMTTLEAQALVGEMQQLAMQAAMSMSPKIMEKIRRIQAARFQELYQRIMLLPNYMGHVNRASVLALVQDAVSRVPQP